MRTVGTGLPDRESTAEADLPEAGAPSEQPRGRGRAIDGVPELLADARGLEAELRVVAEALSRVVDCRALAIYALPVSDGREDVRLAPAAVAGGADGWEQGARTLAQRAMSRWLDRPAEAAGRVTDRETTVLPILYERECVGVLAIRRGDQEMPGDARLRDVGNLVGLAALAIANHRLKAEGRRRIAELRALQEIGRVMGVGLTVESVLDGIFQASADVLSYDTASLFVVDEAAGVLRLAASRNIPPEVVRRSCFRVGEGVVGWVIAQDRPATVPDTLKDARYRLSGIRRRQPHSLLVVPLRMRGRVIAALSFARHEPNAFSGHDLELAEVIAAYAAQALEHARLARSAAEADSARQVAELLSSISHDIRAPLTLIRAVVGLFREQLSGVDTQQLELLDTIARASDQLGKLVTTALETSRLESNLLKLERERICLADLAREVVSSLSWRARAGHRLLVDVPASLEVWADPTHLQRVLANLVDNAIKYSPDGGDVVVRGWREEDGVLVSVSDQGIGIDHEHLARVFDRFYRAEKGTASTESFGLGLYICKRVVEAHGGAIHADSALHRGSTFTIWLPAEPTTR